MNWVNHLETVIHITTTSEHENMKISHLDVIAEKSS